MLIELFKHYDRDGSGMIAYDEVTIGFGQGFALVLGLGFGLG